MAEKKEPCPTGNAIMAMFVELPVDEAGRIAKWMQAIHTGACMVAGDTAKYKISEVYEQHDEFPDPLKVEI